MLQESMNPSAPAGSGIQGQETLAGGIRAPASAGAQGAAPSSTPSCPDLPPEPSAQGCTEASVNTSPGAAASASREVSPDVQPPASPQVSTDEQLHLCPEAPPDPLAHVRHAARFVIIGETQDGRRFRPSDWAERLAGVMAAFRPRKKSGGRSGVGQFHLGYSPYVLPSMYQGFKCVIVDRRLHEIEPLAHNFVLNFALDNRLRTEVLD